MSSMLPFISYFFAVLLFLAGKVRICPLVLAYLGHWFCFSIFNICSKCVITNWVLFDYICQWMNSITSQPLLLNKYIFNLGALYWRTCLPGISKQVSRCGLLDSRGEIITVNSGMRSQFCLLVSLYYPIRKLIGE